MKRAFDFVLSLLGLIVASPVLAVVMFLVWSQDRHSPLYIAPRVGRDGIPFRMVKLRSMVINADKSGVDSTAADDMRITQVGHFIRRYKLDEVMQLWNVFVGDMSLVGPRPNVERDVRLYTTEEKRLLSIRPGITDFSSIVFADEGDILQGRDDPDLAYNQLIRPWKSRLGLYYVDNRTLGMDFRLIVLTIVAILSRVSALNGVVTLLRKHGAPHELVRVAGRSEPLMPYPPPGADEIIMNRS